VSESVSSPNRQIFRAAGVVMFGMALSSVIGLITTILITRTFGTQSDINAYFAANRLTEILFVLVSGGALASAYLPTFTGFLTRGDLRGAWRMASAVANLVLLILVLACCIAWIFAPWVVDHILAPGFSDTGQIELTVSLLRIMLITPILFGMSGLLMATLQAHQNFILPALAPAAYRLGMILGIFLFVPKWGIYGLAWGVVLGTCMHLIIQIPGLRGKGATYSRTLGLDDPAVAEVGRLMLPRLLGVAVVQINFLVNTNLASRMAEGSVSALTYAFALMIMPQAIIAQAIAIAALPTFSAQVALGQFKGMRDALAATLRGVVFLAFPATVGLILLRREIVGALFERGLFDSQSTELVAWALLWFAAGLLGHSLLEVVSRAFYALHDTRTPVLVGVGAMSLNVLLSILFSLAFLRLGRAPIGGLALANSLATAIEATVLLWLIHRRFGGMDLRAQRRGITAIILASSAMAVTIIIWLALTGDQSVWISGGVGIVLGGAVYWLVALLLGVPDAKEIPGAIFKRGGADA
jgi:putative peptidoglycan lipid II flippase